MDIVTNANILTKFIESIDNPDTEKELIEKCNSNRCSVNWVFKTCVERKKFDLVKKLLYAFFAMDKLAEHLDYGVNYFFDISIKSGNDDLIEMVCDFARNVEEKIDDSGLYKIKHEIWYYLSLIVKLSEESMKQCISLSCIGDFVIELAKLIINPSNSPYCIGTVYIYSLEGGVLTSVKLDKPDRSTYSINMPFEIVYERTRVEDIGINVLKNYIKARNDKKGDLTNTRAVWRSPC